MGIGENLCSPFNKGMLVDYCATADPAYINGTCTYLIAGKSDDPDCPDYVPSIHLGYRTPLRSLDRYRRASQRTSDKGSKRQLPFKGEGKIDETFDHGAAAEALFDLSQLQPNVENTGNFILLNLQGAKHVF